MSGVVPCPTCDYPIPLEVDGCPQCRAARLDRRRPYYIALAVAGALLVWQHDRLLKVWTDFHDEMEKVSRPRQQFVAAPVPPPAPAPSPAFIIQSTPYRPPDPPPSRPVPPVAAPEPPPDVIPMPRPEQAGPPSMYRMYGVVYDLATLKAVPGAVIRFTILNQDARWTAKSDKKGHYQVDVIGDPNLLATVECPGYRPGALEDKDPAYRQRPPKSRRLALEETSDLDLEPFLVRPSRDESLVQLDLVLLPERKK